MNLSTTALKLTKIITELRRPNLTTEDKGKLVTMKDQLTTAMTIEEQAAKKALETLHHERIAEVEYKFKEAKKAASNYSKAIQKELLNVQKGFEATERLGKLIEENSQFAHQLKHNESNRAHPRTSQTTAYIQTQFIKQSVVSDFFTALGVNFKNIDHYKGYHLSNGVKKENVNDLIKRLSEMKLNDVDISQWYLDNHDEKSRISQDVQEMMKEEL